MKKTHRNLLRIIGGTVVLLLIPFIAMQFTDEVQWSLADFVVAGVLLLGTGFIYELAVKKIRNTNYRIAVGLALLAALFVIWIELAVGIFN